MSNVRQALAAPPIRRYLSSVAASSVGIQLLITVLFKQAFDITGDELSIGLIGLAQFIPGLLLVLVSGYVADRFDRRRVTALFIGGRALCAIALVAYSIGDSGALWPLLAIAVVFGASDAMMMPSSRSISPFDDASSPLPGSSTIRSPRSRTMETLASISRLMCRWTSGTATACGTSMIKLNAAMSGSTASM